MTLNNLLPLLEDLQSILQSTGCKVTNVAVAICSAGQETPIDVSAMASGAQDERAITPTRE
jgi:hypothetical protein